jgi:hypothetical protein
VLLITGSLYLYKEYETIERRQYENISKEEIEVMQEVQ